ncbi:MAG: polymerase sigma factor cnrH [Planctomycetota bacterium]|jgi:RNA polymerase sigma-70 factor (ECF subfamily)
MTDSGKSIWPNGDQTNTLLVAARSGDQQAVSQLLEKHRGAVRRLVELRLDRKVQRRVDVSDVVQEVMFEASGRLDRYLQDPAMAFHLWIRQIAWDRIIDTYRRHRVSAKRNMDREQPISAPQGADQSTLDFVAHLRDPALTPAAAATQAEMARCVEAAIDRLPEQDREVILMRHYEHLSNLEIAEALGLNPPAASMRYLRALRRLRQLLADPAADSIADNESEA